MTLRLLIGPRRPGSSLQAIDHGISAIRTNHRPSARNAKTSSSRSSSDTTWISSSLDTCTHTYITHTYVPGLISTRKQSQYSSPPLGTILPSDHRHLQHPQGLGRLRQACSGRMRGTAKYRQGRKDGCTGFS